MDKNMSILLGSGFSYPARIPSVGKINGILTSLTPEEIFWGMDRYVFLLKGQPDPNARLTIDKRNFFVEFIKYYCDSIGGHDNFNYEVFYDFYYSMYREDHYDDIADFCESFRSKYRLHDISHDNANLILTFNDGFNQILRYLLGRPEFFENNVHKFNYTNYDNLIKYLVDLAEAGYIVHIHTLNHDLLFDHIGKVTDIQSYFCDGFSELGLSYYGDLDLDSSLSISYKVRLKGFQNIYNKPIRFYKLHGSIDTYSFNLSYPHLDRTRIKTEYAVEDIYKEIFDEKAGEHKYIKGIKSVYPDFLSGTTEKLRNYSDVYYEIIFTHFKQNLNSSNKLIIIGYGFKDKGINEILETYLNSKKEKTIVIDPNKSTAPFYRKHEFNHISKSISQIGHDEFKNL
ncbi:MAG: SIR2 family protein [Saprospiraceae bacterium]|nr:SIR2 family protein [Saprospiraceae bacterium]